MRCTFCRRQKPDAMLCGSCRRYPCADCFLGEKHLKTCDETARLHGGRR